MTTAELERSVTSLIEEAMDRVEVFDPAAVAELVLVELDEEKARRFAIRGLAEYVRCVGKRHRRGQKSLGSGRWDDVKRAGQSGALDLARISIWTGTAHKWLLDASASDLTDAADEHMRYAAGHERSAEQLGKLATALRRAKAETVGDLPVDQVRRVFDA